MTTTSKPHAATLPDDLLDPVDEFADEDGLNDALIELDDDGQPIVDAEDEDEDDLGEDIDALAYDAPDLDTMLKAAVGSNDGDRRCGLIAIVGRPNVGKSTLLNTLIGQKVSITSRKAQTTRHRITGISTQADTQYVFVDTPGFQTTHTTRGTAALNRNLNKTVQSVLGDVDVVLFVVDAGRFNPADAKVLSLIPPGKPTFLIANKLDLITRRSDLLPWLQQMQARHAFTEFVPLTATKKDDTQRLLDIIRPYLPEQPWYYDEDALTDRSDKFLAAELIREKLFRLTGDELPYTSTVQIDKYEEVEGGRLNRIAATIIVERDAHKGMVIGEGGERLKRISTEARTEMERLTGRKVFLEVWVKVRSGWADDEKRLKSYGYE
ncbi:GTP-binding protein Era [Sphaerotilus montanus]|jgi:GTP-binding protein Era|uniref:GTPase Era n=2 Tax=Sphaerotilus montanus TaxID=522889 RepID=A0A7Y9QUZ4_9BURK|nr:GTP-binding protein Era [Sphaerotilus montanus]